MNILIYSSKYPPQTGGVEEVVKNLSVNLSLYNKILVVTSFNLRSGNPNLLRKMFKGFRVSANSTFEKVPVSYLFMSLPRSLFGVVVFPLRFFVSVIKHRRIIRKFKPDVINAHFLDDSLMYFYMATFFKKVKVVLDIHGNELHVFSKNKVYRYFYKKVLKKASVIIVHSDYMKDELLKRYKINKPIEIIPNSVDLTKFKATKKPMGDYYLFVGRLDYKKGIDVLIKAYKNVSHRISRKLIIIGGSSGERKHGRLNIDSLKQMAQGANVEFLGRVDNSKIKEYYQHAFYSIFPSRNEPFGIVALESTACGTPFIGSSGGFKEIAKNTEAGVIFKEGSVKNLTNLLLKIDKDTEKRKKLSERGLKNINKYSLDLFIKHYYNVLTKWKNY